MRTAFVIAMLAACGKHDSAPPAPAPTPQTPATPATPAKPSGCQLSDVPAKFAQPKRVVAIGDIHGDLKAAEAALRTAGAIDDKDTWIGGDLVVVQTGDVLDRGNDESKIFELLWRLEGEAAKQGGAVIELIGNHELMNAAHDFRYVTAGGAMDFGGDRDHALGPGGEWAKKIARHNVVAVVGDTVYSHAGVLGDWVTHVDDVNKNARCWLDGQAKEPADALTHDDSPVWTRELGGPGPADCAKLDAALQELGAKRMVVGHTVQKAGITSDCDGKLWRIDVGLAKLYDGPIQVLDVTADGGPKILTGARIP